MQTKMLTQSFSAHSFWNAMEKEMKKKESPKKTHMDNIWDFMKYKNLKLLKKGIQHTRSVYKLHAPCYT